MSDWSKATPKEIMVDIREASSWAKPRAYQPSMLTLRQDKLFEFAVRLDSSESAIKRIRELHQPVYGSCRTWCSENDDQDWPCSTMRALDDITDE